MSSEKFNYLGTGKISEVRMKLPADSWTRIKEIAVTSKLFDSDISYSDKTKLQNNLIATKATIRSLYAEVSDLSDEIFGDWKPQSKRDSQYDRRSRLRESE